MKKVAKAAPIVFLIVGSIILTVLGQKKFDKVEKRIEDFELDVEGYINRKSFVDGNSGLIFIDVTKANHKTYGLENTSQFICKLIEDEAVFVGQNYKETQPMDSIKVSGVDKNVRYYRNGNLYRTDNLWISTVPYFWQRSHRLLEYTKFKRRLQEE